VSGAEAPVPAPVARYLAVAAPGRTSDGAPVAAIELAQRGRLRTAPLSKRWLPFSATHTLQADQPGFRWHARVELVPLVHLAVVDALADGVAAGEVRLFSRLRLASERGTPELNSGALHRYLAEAVWCPPALAPSERLRWTALDDRSALATLGDGATTVSLEFRFGDDDLVRAVFTPARWGRFDGRYEQRAWEGHFDDYRESHGLVVPRRGEVGWFAGDALRIVWQAEVDVVRVVRRPSAPGGNAQARASACTSTSMRAPP
jgi:hypothetical protein